MKLWQRHFNFVVKTVLAGGLSPLGARRYIVATTFGSCLYTGPYSCVTQLLWIIRGDDDDDDGNDDDDDGGVGDGDDGDDW